LIIDHWNFIAESTKDQAPKPKRCMSKQLGPFGIWLLIIGISSLKAPMTKLQNPNGAS
jgi:hypothetical protein